MPTIRVATFNCENLFARFKFEAGINPATASANGFTVNETKFDFLNEVEKALTARAIRAVNADVIALQEVDNHDVLKRFRTQRLQGMGYTHTMLVDANDPRHIDVAILSRFPIVAARPHQHLKSGAQPLFSRLPGGRRPGERRAAHAFREPLQVDARQEQPHAGSEDHQAQTREAVGGGQDDRPGAVRCEPRRGGVAGPR